jgi:hypothetical protein
MDRGGALVVRLLAVGWGLAIVVGLAVGALAPPAWQAAVVADGPACPLRAATGVDCPFCGLTRATVALGAGRWHEALAAHALAPLALLGMLAVVATIALGRGASLATGWRPGWVVGAILALWIGRLILAA